MNKLQRNRRVLPSRVRTLLASVLATTMLAACVAPSTRITKPEEFADTDIHSHTFAGSTAMACEAARRALLSQGYVISENKETLVRGQKNFQPDSDIHVQIEFNVVCAADGKGSNSTTTFANAVRDRYSLKKSSTSASVGVSVLGSLSLPFGFNDDAMVKVASETIDSQRFYEQFFNLVERYFDDTATVPDVEAPETAAAAGIKPGPAALQNRGALPTPTPAPVPASTLSTAPAAATIMAPQLAPIVAPAAAPLTTSAPVTAPAVTPATPAATTAAGDTAKPRTTPEPSTTDTAVPANSAIKPVPAN